MTRDHSSAPTIALTVLLADGQASAIRVPVHQAFNFGFAARDQAALREHLRDTQSLGVPPPATIPALYPIPPDRVTTAADIVVSGADTYGEVEYALVRDSQARWLITVASDHTDAGVERGSIPRGKGITPNVLAPTAWALAEVEPHLDQLTLSCACADAGPADVVQRDSLAALLPPSSLITTLMRRAGVTPEPGTVILSGTIGGELPTGAREWVIALEDPVLNRRIDHHYAVSPLPDELAEPARGSAIAGATA